MNRLMHFFAKIKDGKTTAIKKLDTDASLQSELTAAFQSQYETLICEKDEIPFDPKRPIETDSQYCAIGNYELPQEYRFALENQDQHDLLNPTKDGLSIISLFATEVGGAIYFQAFRKSRLLQRNAITVLFRGVTLQRLSEAGLTFDDKLAVAFVGGKLVFRSFSLAASCLDLAEYRAQASDEEILELLVKSPLHAEDPDASIAQLDGWMRRRFDAIRESGVLDKITPKKIQSKAKKYGIKIKTKKVDGEQNVLLPKTKKEAKDVLRFLYEGYYQGELTGTLFSTDSHDTVGK